LSLQQHGGDDGIRTPPKDRWSRQMAIGSRLFTLIPPWYHLRVALTVRTDDKLEKALTVLAAAEGTSRQEIIRRAVLERYERSGHVDRVAGSTKKMQQQWGDVLERLRTT
jgi:Ribbon-helix-helix protein, copG family